MKTVKVLEYDEQGCPQEVDMFVPDFVHDHGTQKTNHVYRGSLSRHLAVERILYRIKSWLTYYCYTTHYHKLLSAIVSLCFGLNCNFPMRDIIRYVVWGVQTGYVEIYLEVESKTIPFWLYKF